MAFTIHLDNNTEELLKLIQQEIGVKSKTQAIRALIHNFSTHQQLQESYLTIQRENEVLMNVNFVSKVLTKLDAKLTSGRDDTPPPKYSEQT
ncbi:MAG: hypothetical protein WBA23_00780 [Tunicatimonas sp.]|uniref:hypothetical protein n=1 Tax=Tunicatimonas sp. TaxID=1940096 RepID=UPI003C726CDD